MNKPPSSGSGSIEAQEVRDLEFMRWNETQMATGVASIDTQHKELIRRLNELHKACLAGASAKDIDGILKFLGEYAQVHFTHEEALMESGKCPIREVNRQAHARFLEDYQKMVAAFQLQKDCAQTAIEVKIMTAQWLTSHICRIDMALRSPPAGGQAPSPGQ